MLQLLIYVSKQRSKAMPEIVLVKQLSCSANTVMTPKNQSLDPIPNQLNFVHTLTVDFFGTHSPGFPKCVSNVLHFMLLYTGFV